MLAEALLLAPGLLALVWLGIPLQEGTGFQPIAPRVFSISLGIGVSLWVASYGLLELQYSVWQPDAGYLKAFRRIHLALRPTGAADAVMSVLAIAVLPAVCEEILVRGIVLPAFVRSLGPAMAVCSSALLFGLMHDDLYRFAFTTSVGLALGVVRLRSGSVLPSVLAHTILNALTFTVTLLFDDPSAPLPPPRPLLGLGLLALGGAPTWLAIRWLRR